MKTALKRKPAPSAIAPADDGLPDACAASVAIPDPLRLAIANYNYGVALFECVSEADWEKAGGEQAVIAATYGPPYEALCGWDKPALTVEGAIEALGLIIREAKWHASSPMTGPLAEAVLQYLKAAKAKAQ